MTKRIIYIMILSSILSFFGCKNKQEKSKEEIEMDKAFEEWNNRPIYKVLTVEILDNVSDDLLEQTIMDNIDTNFEKGEQYTLNKVSKFTKGQQAVFSTWWLEAEVNNGGFNQFYFNSSGQFAEMAEIGFETFGAEKFSELTSKANKIYSENKERLEEFDDGTMESFSESYKDNPLNELDTEFYGLGETESVSNLRIKYIREHLREFITE